MLKHPLSCAILGLTLSAGVNAAVNSDNTTLSLKPIGTYESGLIDESAAEIVAHDPRFQLLYVSNAKDQSLDVISIRAPRHPYKIFSIDISTYGEPNSVSINKGVVAVAVDTGDQQVGQVVFFNRWGKFLNAVDAGFLPDMLTFTPDGSKILVANEGEPSDDYTVDPEGSISIIDLSAGVKNLTNADVTNADFSAFIGLEAGLKAEGVRIFGPGANAAQDLEPEYITVSEDSSTAWVALQENNALAVVDIATATVVDVVALGTKNHNTIQNAFDASNRDDAINIQPWPTHGMYQPDAITSYTVDGETYIVSANEGDSRDYDGYSEEERVKDLTLDPALLAAYPGIQDDENLGRLKTTTANGDTDGDGDFDKIYSYGARSFSIWNAAGEIVYDSGSDFGRITADVAPELFNYDSGDVGDEGEADGRSDDKGAEPEGVVVGEIKGRTYAFIGLERTSGIMVYDVTNPIAPKFMHYVNNLQPGLTDGNDGDVAPEGLLFIPKNKSPNRKPLLVVTNEFSGTTTIYRVKVD